MKKQQKDSHERIKDLYTPLKRGFQCTNNSSYGIWYHLLVALQQLSMRVLLSDGKYEFIYPFSLKAQLS